MAKVLGFRGVQSSNFAWCLVPRCSESRFTDPLMPRVSLTGSKDVLEEISLYAVDTGNAHPTPLELANQVTWTSQGWVLKVVLLYCCMVQFMIVHLQDHGTL